MAETTGIGGKRKTGLPPFGDDRELVSRLIEMDAAAWEFVIGERIFPALARSAKWSSMLRRYCVSHEDVASEVFYMVTADNCRHLREFRYECAFSTRLYDWIMAAMTTIVRKLGKEIPKDLSDFNGEIALTQQSQLSAGDIAVAREALEGVNTQLVAVWEANPVQTLVLLMRDAGGLSAKEVAVIFGVSPANVDQMHKRAKTRLEKLCGKGGCHVLN